LIVVAEIRAQSIEKVMALDALDTGDVPLMDSEQNQCAAVEERSRRIRILAARFTASRKLIAPLMICIATWRANSGMPSV